MRGSLSVIAVAACLFTACTSGERQRLQLEELERMNRADSVMLNDSLARALADWFDRHGTPNEQLRAYYMLGRTYAEFDWPFTPTHTSSGSFSTLIGADLHPVLPGLHPGHV